MPWFRVDDGFHSHPKVLATPPAALGLWVVAGSWSSAHLTDGMIPDRILPLLLPDAEELAQQLVAAKLWKRVRGGFKFHDWAHKNPTRQAVENAREKNRERQRRWQDAHNNAVTNAVTNAVSNGATNSAPALPSPSKGSAVTEPARGRHSRPVPTPSFDRQRPNPERGERPYDRDLAAALEAAHVNGAAKPARGDTVTHIAAEARRAMKKYEAADGA